MADALIRRCIMVVIVFAAPFYYYSLLAPRISQNLSPTSGDIYGFAALFLLPLVFSAFEASRKDGTGAIWGGIFGVSLACSFIYSYNYFIGYPIIAMVFYYPFLSLVFGIGYFFGGMVVGSVFLGLWEWINSAEIRARAEEERREAEKARKILEAKRVHIRSLIDETRGILESVERDPKTVVNEPKLVAVRFAQSELEHVSEMFEAEETSVDDSERRISELNLQAKTLAKSTKLGVAEETPYSILGVSPKATLEEIKDARDRKIWFYHEDHIKGYPDWAKEEANEMAKKINIAYDELLKSKNTKSAGS